MDKVQAFGKNLRYAPFPLSQVALCLLLYGVHLRMAGELHDMTHEVERC